MDDFWQQLPKPFFALAPMEDVTDAAFRRLIAKYGKPDVFYTEFTSADGLVRADESGKRKLLKKLEYSEAERPVVAQLFSAEPEYMEAGARLAADLGFDGIDINMGCPDRSVEKQGCGAALMKNPTLARELIRAAKRGANDGRPTSIIPISVKTRIGYNKNELDTWLPELLAEEPAAVAIHARTRKEMSDVPAHWETIKQAVTIRDSLNSDTYIVGNGDVQDVTDAHARATETGCDGVMLGRAIYGNPWLFADRPDEPSPRERLEVLAEHVALFEELMLETTSFAVMKKHFKAYVSGWDDAKELRVHLMDTTTPQEALAVIKGALRRLS